MCKKQKYALIVFAFLAFIPAVTHSQVPTPRPPPFRTPTPTPTTSGNPPPGGTATPTPTPGVTATSPGQPPGDDQPPPSAERTPDPDEEEDCREKIGCGNNLRSGNFSCTWKDPTRTRGFPLRNTITINSQSNFPTRTTVFGNASFSYGIEVYRNPSGVYYLIDGDGSEFLFGTTLTPEPRVHSVLSQTSDGFLLSNAGAPGSIEEAGNFSYAFNTVGKLTVLIDPAGNKQTVVYNADGYPAEIVEGPPDEDAQFASLLVLPVSAAGGFPGGLHAGPQVYAINLRDIVRIIVQIIINIIHPPPTPTPVPTPTRAPTRTPVPTATRTPTRAPTAAATSTPTRTPTSPPTLTPSATPTLTPTSTSTPTPTPTVVPVDPSAEKRRIILEYDTPGRVARIVENGRAAVTHVSYSDSGKITSFVLKNPTGAVIRRVDFTYQAYDGNELVSSATRDQDPATRIDVSYVRGGANVYLADVSWDGGGTGIDYNQAPASGFAFRTNRRTAQAGTIVHDLDAAGNIVRITAPALNGASSPKVVAFTYAPDRQPLTMTDGLVSHAMTYAENGKLTRLEDGAGNFVSYTYTGTDLTKVEDNSGVVEEYLFTDASHPHVPTERKDGAGNTWTTTLNAFGQPTVVSPPPGSPTRDTDFAYDEDAGSPTKGYLAAVTNGALDVTVFGSYTPLGDVAEVSTSPRDGVINTVKYTYDAAQRMTSVEHPDGRKSQNQYVNEFLNSVTDEAGSVVSYDYCKTCSKVTGMVEPLGRSQTWDQNGDHQTASFTDPRGFVTAYSYGLAGELKEVAYPDGTFTRVSYASHGRVTDVTSPASSTRYGYDAAGRISSQTVGTDQNTFEYFPDGRLKKAVSSASTVEYGYNLSRLIEKISTTFPAPTAVQTVEYAYNPDHTVRTMAWKNADAVVGSVTYGYDGAGRITSLATSWGDSSAFTYDGEGKVLLQTNSNGTETSYTYNDARGWITKIVHKKGASVLDSFSIEYDGGQNTVGNITKVTEADGSAVVYTYDALYRLTSETRTGAGAYSKSYGYDLSGNITAIDAQPFATYDSANKIAMLSGGTAEYDGNGNLSRAVSPQITERRFSFDALNRPTTHTNAAGTSVTYGYDAEGRRARRVNGVVTEYVFDKSDNLVGEVSGGVPSAIYVWGPTGIVVERLLDGAARSRWYHFGPQAETRYLTDDSGMLSSSYRFSGYGETLASSESDYNSFRSGGSVGYYTDTLIGEILATYRWYDPYLMRWLSRDPIGYEGGSNQYEYVGGRPSIRVDPSGLIPIKNAGGSPFLYKPEDPKDGRIGWCMPGQWCDADGWYPDDPSVPAEKWNDSCPVVVVNDCKLPAFGGCLDPWGYKQLDRTFFDEHPDWPNPYSGANGWPTGLMPGGRGLRPQH